VRTLRFGTAAWRRYLERRRGDSGARPGRERAVSRILAAVRRDGDAALVRLTRRFDGVRLEPRRLWAATTEVRALARRADPELVAALRAMARRIESFHRRQLLRGFSMRLPDGSRLEERVAPIGAVGLYVPGGAGAYPSSVLMNAIPAQVAGVPRIVVATPPRSLETNPAVAAALTLIGLERSVLRVGGAQGIAALAFGTRSVEPVAKIVGPGNAFVAAAKRQVRGRVEIDQDAGPSEVVILADASADPRWVAADLLAQAEHGSGDEAVVLVTDSESLASEVPRLVAGGVSGVANAAAARRALRRNGAVVRVRDIAAGVAAVNALAPEHAQVMTRSASRVARGIVAGGVFVGSQAPVAVGDYGVGPNHVLPTGGAARFSSPLSVRDFQRSQGVVTLTRSGLRRLAPGVMAVARAEGFIGHARSVALRLPGKAARGRR
jgi:histidinol dehydrogenase